MAAPKPQPGTPVESTWGGQVHDSAVSAIGVVARADPTTATTVPLIFVEGVASMVNGTDIVIPVAGVYHIEATLNATGGGEGGAYRGFLNKNDVDANSGMAFPTKSGSNVRGVCSWDGMCNAGDRFRLSWGLVGGSGTPQWTIQRISVRLVAQAWAA